LSRQTKGINLPISTSHNMSQFTPVSVHSRAPHKICNTCQMPRTNEEELEVLVSQRVNNDNVERNTEKVHGPIYIETLVIQVAIFFLSDLKPISFDRLKAYYSKSRRNTSLSTRPFLGTCSPYPKRQAQVQKGPATRIL
jgi:hypothetical protein